MREKSKRCASVEIVSASQDTAIEISEFLVRSEVPENTTMSTANDFVLLVAQRDRRQSFSFGECRNKVINSFKIGTFRTCAGLGFFSRYLKWKSRSIRLKFYVIIGWGDARASTERWTRLNERLTTLLLELIYLHDMKQYLSMLAMSTLKWDHLNVVVVIEWSFKFPISRREKLIDDNVFVCVVNGMNVIERRRMRQ